MDIGAECLDPRRVGCGCRDGALSRAEQTFVFRTVHCHFILVPRALVFVTSPATLNVLAPRLPKPAQLPHRPPRQHPKERDHHPQRQHRARQQRSLHPQPQHRRRQRIRPRAHQPRGPGPTAPRREAKLAIIVRQAQETQLAPSTTQAREHDTHHLDRHGSAAVRVRGRERDQQHAGRGDGGEEQHAHRIGEQVDEVGGQQLGEEGGHDVEEEDGAFGR